MIISFEGEELVHAELEVAGGIIGIDGALLKAGEHLLDLGLGTPVDRM